MPRDGETVHGGRVGSMNIVHTRDSCIAAALNVLVCERKEPGLSAMRPANPQSSRRPLSAE